MNLVVILPESVGGGKRKRPAGDNGDISQVRKLVTEYITDDMLSLTTVESPDFKG